MHYEVLSAFCAILSNRSALYPTQALLFHYFWRHDYKLSLWHVTVQTRLMNRLYKQLLWLTRAAHWNRVTADRFCQIGVILGIVGGIWNDLIGTFLDWSNTVSIFFMDVWTEFMANFEAELERRGLGQFDFNELQLHRYLSLGLHMCSFSFN